jgi:predicted permease
MIQNYFRLAWRNLLRHRSFSVINICGLAVGIAAVLLLFAVIAYELSYNTDQPNYKSIYHVVTVDKTPDGLSYTPGIPFPALEALRLDVPEATTGTLLANFGSQVTVIDAKGDADPNKKFIEETGFFFSDPEFFQIFKYEWLSGSPSILAEPNVTVLTEKLATKYFGDWKSAIGRSLLLDNAITVNVGGVIKDPPLNSDYPLGIVTSFETAKRSNGVYFYSDEWGATTSNFQLFMLLPHQVSADRLNKELIAFSEKHYPKNARFKRSHFLQPLSQVHFDERFDSFGGHVISKSTLWTLALIGIFIIVMACVNFINLSTAQAVRRSKEIGIRKVLGGYRKQVFFQILIETLFIVCIAVLFAVGIALVGLPFIKNITSIEEPLSIANAETVYFLLATVVFVTLFAGLYPAVILAGFRPAAALKNKITSASVGGILLRRGLVVLQFAISQVLIIGTMIAVSQMNFVRSADLGFNKEAVLVVNANTDSIAQSRQQSFKRRLLQLPGVKSVSFSSDVPSSQNNSATNFSFDHKPEPDFNLYVKFADEDYFQTYGLELVAGQTFSKQSDTINEVVVNETLVKKLHLKSAESIVGKQLVYGGGNRWKTIVGVVKDFKTNSLKEDIKPLAIAQRRSQYYVTAVKLHSSNLKNTRSAVETAWNGTYPEYAFTSSFFDESIDEFYEQDEQLSLLYKIFAGIAVLISCLGLYGLITFMAAQRVKEIGVRKVLGASVQNIVFLFSKEFTVLVLIGCLVAIPVAWYMMGSWLQNFVYRIEITPAIYMISIGISLLVAWLSVGYKSVSAALANPVTSLKSE